MRREPQPAARPRLRAHRNCDVRATPARPLHGGVKRRLDLGERPAAVVLEDDLREVARHQDAVTELAERRLGPLAGGERERELGITRPRRGRQREAAAETRVDVGDRQRAVRLAEALDVCGANHAHGLRDAPPMVDQLRILDRHALDGFAAFRLDHCSRDRIEAARLEVAEDIDRELLAPAHLLDHRIGRRVAEEEVELGAIFGSIDVPGAEAAPRLDEQRERRVSGDLAGEPGRRRRNSVREEEGVRGVLVLAAADRLRIGQQDERAEPVAFLGEQEVVEVGQRHDQFRVVLVDEPPQGVDVPRIAHRRHERAAGRRRRARERACRRRPRGSSRRRGRTR